MSNIPAQADNDEEAEYFEAEVEAQTEDEEYEGVAAENLEEKLEKAEVSPASVTASREIVVSEAAASASSDQSLSQEPEKLSDNPLSSAPTETKNVTPVAQKEAKARLFESETITLVLQLLPDDGDAAGRPVLLAVRHARTAPDYLLLRETDLGHLPLPLQSMLGRLKTTLATAPSPSAPHLRGQVSQTTRSNTSSVNQQDRTEPKANETQSNNHSANSSPNPAQLSTATQEAQAQTNLSNGKEDKGRSKQLSLFD